MRSFFLLLLSVLLLSPVGCIRHHPSTRENTPTPAQAPPAAIPIRSDPVLRPIAGDPRRPRFEETVDQRARAANLERLWAKKLVATEFEFRVWVGFGKKPLEGFIVTRRGGEWTGAFLESINPTKHPPYRLPLTPPKGWDQIWNDLLDAGLFTLPDSSQLPDEREVFDGTSYVVEIKQGDVYRTYFYPNPDWQKWPEAKQILRIADILYSGFGVERYPLPDHSPSR